MHNFIHRHVLNTVFEDLEEIWLLNQILLCASIEDNTANYKDISLIQKLAIVNTDTLLQDTKKL